ncbi:MAG: FecR domain-containing protein, partial [Polyangiaceae bacterium]|nr:FecR domain-containing protein [Polyangiaceae bacterium]
GVQKGETCDDIAKVVYGSTKHVALLLRYNRVACDAARPLPEGLTLVLPAEVTEIPDARIRSMHPDVRARPDGGGSWVPATKGMPLRTSGSVNTLDEGRADVEFVDRSRIFLAPNTLVVIYGTASRTRVSKTAPAAVEVQAGEVKAALAALRGQSVEVALPGGGRVSAASRDTVVQRKGERTTVAVFDGKAGVTSGGKSVEVPKDFGTRFTGAAPPAPPRPLPPAPAWDAGGPGIGLCAGGQGVVTAAWKPVPGAIGYRVEVARDREMNDLVAREEVPPDILSFRGERLPVGSYSIRVRAIDREEYLGVGAVRELHLVGVEIDAGGRVDPQEISASPYATLSLAPSSALEMAIDDGPFGPMVERVDLKQRAPREIRLRARGGSGAVTIPVRPLAPEARIEAARAPGGRALAIRAALTGLDGVDVPRRVSPRVRVRLPPDPASPAAPAGEPISAALSAEGAALVATAPLPAYLAPERAAGAGPLLARIDVVDDRGRVIGTLDADLAIAAPAPDHAAAGPEEPRFPVIGAWAPMLSLSPVTDTLWLPPTPPTAAALGAGAWKGEGGWVAEGQIRATGAIGPIGLDAALRSNATGEGDAAPRGGAGWLGARARVLRIGLASLELAPALRIGFPLSSAAPPARIEPSIAVGGAAGRLSWIIDAGARVRAEDDGGAAGAPPSQGFLLAGATIEPVPWLRLHVAADGHLVHRDEGDNDVVAGIGAGVEAGGALFGALSLRAGPPADDREGAITGQLAVGVREAAP